VRGGFVDWCQVSVGPYITLAVRTNGSLWAWGENICGRLGDGTTTNKSSPISVVGGFVDWCQVSAGYIHVAALRTNGSLWAWGSGANGVLGDGTTVAKCSPISVVGGFTDWCQVSAGDSHTSAVRTNGTLWTWGNNNDGKLGDGTTTNKLSPVAVVYTSGYFTPSWCQVSVGGEHTLAIINDTLG
jgi:alpha-tubulin suppressor-like RCC1 family protein